MFETIFANGNVTPVGVFLALFTALLSGTVFALLTGARSGSTKSFTVATALLPMAVAMVIALVNGNIGAGVAIAGAFSLVRFRSATGTAKEIVTIFIAMVAGMAFGMGFLGYGVVFILVMGLGLFFVDHFRLFEHKTPNREMMLKITIPENLNYGTVFDDIFAEYLKEVRKVRVKTSNMGSMYRLTYRVTMKDPGREKEMLDALRVRNGNLDVSITEQDYNEEDL